MVLTILFAIAGIDTIVAGAFAIWYIRRLSTRHEMPRSWKLLRIVALVSGFALAFASSHPGCYVGYPLRTEDGVGTVIGVPFLVAFFDAQGRDYVGPLTLPAVFGNAVFCFMLPQIGLAIWGWRYVRRPPRNKSERPTASV